MSYLTCSKLILPSVLIALVGCGKTLDTAKIEDTIQSGITQQGGKAIKSVICPDNIKPEAGKEFECTGVLDSGAGFAIVVKQQDAEGNIFWEASSVKGLLNMTQLQTQFEQGLKKEIGQASIDCGKATAYRSVKPGETFECQLLQRRTPTTPEDKSQTAANSTKSAQANDTIQVTIQPSGDINWQRITKLADAKLPTPTTSPQKPTESIPPETPKPESADSEKAPTPPAAKSPEDFLNQPGAADNF